MLAIAPKLRQFLIDHIEQAQPDELAGVIERLLDEPGPLPPLRVTAQGQIIGLARMPFADRVIKLGPSGQPIERDDEPHVAVYDPLLDLTWARADFGDQEVKQGKADKLAAEFRLFNLDGWRQPTVFEFQSTVDRKRHSPAVDTTVLDACPNWYWTSETYAPAPAGRWCVLLDSGYPGGLNGVNTAFARAVRAGQPFVTRP